MITVPQATEKIIKRSRFLTEAMSKNLINASSLARYIKPEVEQMVFKTVTHASIMMAIKRLENSITPHYKAVSFPEAPDMVVRSNLHLFHVRNSTNLLRKLALVEKASSNFQKKALFSYGRSETLILCNKLSAQTIQDILEEEHIEKTYRNISSITIHLPKNSIDSPGVFYFFIKSLAWEGINILDILSTQTEFVLIFQSKDVNEAFRILHSLFTE